MELTFTQKKSIRKNFGKLKESLSIPNLIEVQKNSYKQFIESKSDTAKSSSLDKGLTKVFKSIFPINDSSEKSSLEFISCSLDKPKFGGPGRLKQKCKLRMCLNLSRHKNSSSSSKPLYRSYVRNKIKRSWHDSDDVYGFLGKSVLYENDSGVLVRGILKQWSRGDDFIPPLWQVASTNDKSPRTFYLREVVHVVTEGMRPTAAQ